MAGSESEQKANEATIWRNETTGPLQCDPLLEEKIARQKAAAFDTEQDLRSKHRRRWLTPIELPQRKLLAKCYHGEQVYSFGEGVVPHCPECGNVMHIIAEMPK